MDAGKGLVFEVGIPVAELGARVMADDVDEADAVGAAPFGSAHDFAVPRSTHEEQGLA